MSEHTVAVIEKKKLSDGQISVCLECCSDPSTQAWHTLIVTPNTTAQEIIAWLDGRKNHVSAQHDAMQAADNLLGTI